MDRHSPEYKLHRASPVSSDRGSVYDAHAYPFPTGGPEYRRIDAYANSSHASSYPNDLRSSQTLPPVASLTSSSRGSSLDMDSVDADTMRSQAGSSASYGSHSPAYTGHYDRDPRSSSYPSNDYRYSGNYRAASPPPNGYFHNGGPHSSYYSHSYAPRPDSRASGPYQAPSDLHMDNYDQGRDPNSSIKKRRGNLPKPVTDLLRSWLHDHIAHPYPTEEEKQMLMAQTGLTIHQVRISVDG